MYFSFLHPRICPHTVNERRPYVASFEEMVHLGSFFYKGDNFTVCFHAHRIVSNKEETLYGTNWLPLECICSAGNNYVINF